MNNNFIKYTAYFHDGSLLSIKHAEENIELVMESAEITQNDEDFDNDIVLSNTRRIKGILHLQKVTSIRESDVPISCIEMKYDDGGILNFNLNVSMTEVELNILWCSYTPNVEKYSFYKITAQKIYWENRPHLNLN